MLENLYYEMPTDMLGLIKKRYYTAKKLIETVPLEKLTKEKFNIGGGVRAYLDSASDYMNPLLSEMSKAEQLLEDLYR